ncbi:MAG: argininosuccinate lyase [Verrucomicrobia bacterium]|nr:MAG: argininosuccinate lyase [Verrucomicrobiota bacterium]
MWKGRFECETSDLVRRLGESISFDWRLYAHDIRGSIAHSRALVRAGILSQEEQAAIESGLLGIRDEIARGEFPFSSDLEDIHMNIEAVLTERIGAAGAKLHTARSRNDQVALDVRLFCREETEAIEAAIRALQTALVGVARRHQETILPGYTHLQRGQPVLFAHHLLAYVEMLGRDAGRIADCRRRLNVLPLGSGALAGSTIVVDREAVAEELGFDSVSHNSMDAVSDRDFVAELLFALGLLGVHLSRMAEDLILWTTAEFGFVTLSDAHTTGSSLMPQKKNPDVAELTRGKTGRLIGNLVSILTILKGLPLTYNRDLQEDKEPLFDSVDTIKLLLPVIAEMVGAMEVNEARTRAAAGDPFLLATDIADYLVLRGVPFRQAHEVVGKLTAFSLREGRGFPDLTLEEFRSFSDAFAADVFRLFNLRNALEARRATGAPSPGGVAMELARWQDLLAQT